VPIFLIGDVRRRGPLGEESQLEVADDPIHHGIVGEEGDNLHVAAGSRADQRVNFIGKTGVLYPFDG
jgi:hypothetical protein